MSVAASPSSRTPRRLPTPPVTQLLEEAEELVKKYTKADLENECFNRGLLTSGTKEELKQRVLKDMVDNIQNRKARVRKSTAVSDDNFKFEIQKGVEESLNKMKEDMLEQQKHFQEQLNQLMHIVNAQQEVRLHERDEDKKSRRCYDQEFTRLQKKEKFMRHAIDNILKEINELVSTRNKVFDVKLQLKNLMKQQEEYRSIIEEIVLVLDEESEVENASDHWAIFQKKIFATAGQAEEYIHNAEKCEEQANTTKFDKKVHLPQLKLPNFSGNILFWSPFWDQFKAAVHESKQFSDAQKFVYLKSCLTGPALKCIEGFPVTDVNYQLAVDAIFQRFGRQRIIISELVKSIVFLSAKDKDDGKSLRYLLDTLQNRVRILRSFGTIDINMIMVPLLETKLPNQLKEKWEIELAKLEKDSEDTKVTMELFFEFLQTHVMSKEALEKVSSVPKDVSIKKSSYEASKHRDLIYSASALIGNTRGKPVLKCIFCGEKHPASKCFKADKMNVDERWQKVKGNGNLCYNCLQATEPSHKADKCTAPGCPVDGCGRNHHKLLHKDSDSGLITWSGYVASGTTRKQRILPTAMATLIYEGNELPVRVLFDTGSQETFIRKELADTMSMKGISPLQNMTVYMLGGQPKSQVSKRVKFQLKGFDPELRKVVDMEAWTVSKVCAPLEPVKVELKKYPHLRGIKPADIYTRESTHVDILIGIDHYHELITSNRCKKGPIGTPTAIDSKLGWIVSGNTDVVKGCASSTALLTTIKTDNVCCNLKKFWELESIGIVDNPDTPHSAKEQEAIEQFQEGLRYDGERYEVTLPWEKDHPELVDNYKQAYRRLVSVENKYKNDERREMYISAVNQYINEGHAREIGKEDLTARKVQYLPHHPVFREDKASTKCRVVFDASACNRDGVSLNSCLLAGPSLQPDLVSVLLRFRCHKVALISDIKKMFLQIKLARDDQNVHRFLWRNMEQNKPPRIFCKTRITFGVKSSPFLAIATVKKHADRNKKEHMQACQEIENNMYVDDLLTGEDDDDKALGLHYSLTEVMNRGGFELTKWASNSQYVTKHIDKQHRATSNIIGLQNENMPLKSCLNALGIAWDTLQDNFIFTTEAKISSAKDPETKRSIVSLASMMFDPMGFISAFTVRVKLLFQEMWSRGTNWDERPDEIIIEKWRKWKRELDELKYIQIPRCFMKDLKQLSHIELHGFGDASTKAYGAVVYLRMTDQEGNVKVRFVMSKSRVAPTKRVTLPRLELLAAFILARLMKYILEAVQINVDEIHCWSDSNIALGWIRRQSSYWKTFVANRVQEIHNCFEPRHWRFCPGDQNPSDLLTRGTTLKDLRRNNVWWHGPCWLSKGKENWPVETKNADLTACYKEVKREEMATTCNVGIEQCRTVGETYPFFAVRYEKWIKLLRVTATIRKWLSFKVTSSRSTHLQVADLNAKDIKDAEFCWMRIIQRNNFQEEYNTLKDSKQVSSSSKLLKLDPQFDHANQVIRVGGRLQFADIPEEMKHQIILPHGDLVVEKLIMHIHCQACHAGPETTLSITRQKYWITRGRREVKRIIGKCLVCKHSKTVAMNQKMAPLPADRTVVVPAFTNIGIDFTGCLYIKNNTKKAKAYVCIFSCKTTRAVHFELTNDMTTEEFLSAYRRMSNRRGLSRSIQSDNQSTFHKADKVIQYSVQKADNIWKKIDQKRIERELAAEGVEWKFITERAPHRGGMWERVCRQLKEPLRKVLGKALLTYTEMYTILTDIEAMINSRPLTFVGDDIRDGVAITPSLLSIGRSLKSLPDVCTSKQANISISKRYLYQQQVSHHFWKRWIREYLPKLNTRHKWLEVRSPLKIGDVVLISEDNIPRGKWPMGMVQNIYKGKDGLVRTATLKTKTGIINRPVQRLHLLEESRFGYEEGTCESSDVPQNRTVQKISSGTKKTKVVGSQRPTEGEDVRTRYGRISTKTKRFFEQLK